MRFKMYKAAYGSTQMIGLHDAYAEVRELGHVFAVAMAERGHDMVMKDITDEMFKRAREIASKEKDQ